MQVQWKKPLSSASVSGFDKTFNLKSPALPSSSGNKHKRESEGSLRGQQQCVFESGRPLHQCQLPLPAVGPGHAGRIHWHRATAAERARQRLALPRSRAPSDSPTMAHCAISWALNAQMSLFIAVINLHKDFLLEFGTSCHDLKHVLQVSRNRQTNK